MDKLSLHMTNQQTRRKTWERNGKSKQIKVVRVKIRAGGDLYGPEKPGWSAGDMEKPRLDEKPLVR